MSRFIAIDPGVSNDPTGIVGIDTKAGNIQVIYAQRVPRPTPQEMYELLWKLYAIINPFKISCETNNRGKDFTNAITKFGMDVNPVFTTNRVREKNKRNPTVMPKNFTIAWLKQQTLEFPKNPSTEMQQLIDEVNSIQRFEMGSNTQYKAQRSRHDDLFMALLIAVHTYRVFGTKE